MGNQIGLDETLSVQPDESKIHCQKNTNVVIVVWDVSALPLFPLSLSLSLSPLSLTLSLTLTLSHTLS